MLLILYLTGPEVFEVDEHPKPQTTAEGLTKLKPVFKKGGTVTAGNASVRLQVYSLEYGKEVNSF